MSTENDAKKDVIEAHRAMYRAMLARRTDELGPLLADDYSLTHMTGYKQPKAEWLAAIASGQMRYHAAEEVDIDVDVRGDDAVLVGKSIVTATIYGAKGAWHLQLTTNYLRKHGQWIAMRTVATTF